MNALTKQKHKSRKMNNAKIILLAGIVVLSILVMDVVALEIAPDFTLTDIDGVEFSLSEYRGKVVLLDFFATWCSACVAEFPHLKFVHDEFGEDLIIISISVSPSSDTVEKLQQFRDDHGIDWFVARDTAGVHDKYGNIWPIPTLVIIDQEGYIQHQHSGLTDESVLREEIYEIMGTTRPAISIQSPENKTYTSSSVPLTFTINEPTFWIGYSLDGQANVTITGNTTLTNLSNEVHSVTVYANDTTGNMGHSDRVYFTVSVPLLGALTVTTSSIAGEVFVDGVSWGIVPQSRVVQIGTYTVSFGPVEGYLTPLSELATVYEGQETVVEGVYEEIPTAKAGLRVTTNPVSGDVFVNGSFWGLAPQSRVVDVGTYNVSFGSVAGYHFPSCQLVTVSENVEMSVTGVYSLITGTLAVDTSPVVCEVSVNGTSWGVAPQSRVVQIGTYNVSFGDVAGYNTPGCRLVTVEEDAETVVDGVYELITGTLTITTTPVAGEVFVNGTSWGIAPQTRVVQIGTYIVTFGAAEGFYTPADQVTSVHENAENSIESVYESIAPLPSQPQVLAPVSFVIIAVILVSAIYICARKVKK